MDNLQYIGHKIKEIRKQRKISQELLAEKIGMNYRSIMRIENYQTIPTIETLQKIAKALDVDIVDFFQPVKSDTKEEIIAKINESLQNMNYNKLLAFYIAFKSLSKFE